MAQSSDSKGLDDICLCGKGRLHDGFTELRMKLEDTLLVIKNVPARVCDICDEAYISPETSRRIDEILKNYRAEGSLAKSIQASEIDLRTTA
jgi:YgiT-type zinc finger domain-containing protein